MVKKKKRKAKRKAKATKAKPKEKLWKTLQHNGILFPPEYETQKISIKIKGEQIALNLAQEEMIYQWAKKKDTPYAQDKTFQKNFTADFAKTLDPKFKKISYSDIDFKVAYRVVDKQKDAKDRMTKEARKKLAAQRKEKREELKEKYGTAIMDGAPVEVGNYMAEPPGIFIGRGQHPLRGKWKKRVTQSDVTLNMGKEAKVPQGKWGKIVHNESAMWLAHWTDDLTQKSKYVWLADTAGPKQERDKAKYQKAKKLEKEIDKIKDKIVKDMKSKNADQSRIATACYLIYRTAMRVGDEKDPDEADTVGATTLRKEHVKITKDSIEFDFLGKDSVRWQETIPAASGHDAQFRENLEKLMKNKKPSDEIFDVITSRHVNRYYSSIVKELTAKVFRTYSATKVVKKYLKEHSNIKSKPPYEKLYHAKLANLEAAKMCNHKRTIPKTFQASLQKKRDTLKKVKATKTKTEKQKERKKERIGRLKFQLDLAEQTKDYNLGTSLRNYIDPLTVKAWTDAMDVQWDKLYTAALQKKFLWVQKENTPWKEIVSQ